MKQQHQVLPLSLFKGLCNLSKHPVISDLILSDQYTFAAYLTALGQVTLDPQAIAESKKIADAVALLSQYESAMKGKSSRQDEGFETQEKGLKILMDLKHQLGDRVSAQYSGQFLAWATLYEAVNKQADGKNQARKKLERIIGGLTAGVYELGNRFRTQLDNNLDTMQQLLELNDSERQLIEVCTLFSIDLSASIFLRYFELGMNSRSDLLADLAETMLVDLHREESNAHDYAAGTSQAERYKQAQQALKTETSKPLAFGIARFDQRLRRFGRVSEFWVKALSHVDEDTDGAATFDGFLGQFIREAKAKVSYSGALARISDLDAELVVDMVSANFEAPVRHIAKTDLKTRKGTVTELLKEADDNARGCNVLFYGSRKLDKREVVIKLLKENFETLYELPLRDASTEDYPSIAWVAQRYIEAKKEKAVLIVDKADDVLTKGYRQGRFFFDADGGFGAKHEGFVELDSDEILMTQSSVPTVWLTNSATSLSDESVGRFLLHIEVRGGTREDRRNEVKKVVAELGLSDDIALKLAKYYELGSQQIRSAARLVNLLEKKDPEASELLIRTVENSQKALGRDKTEELRESVTHYSLDLLNLSGKFAPEKIIEALKKRRSGTLCFYGLPGTGKTQLAEYMAMQLDLPIIIKRASDILSMWLGENEQNIKKMFEEARSEGALLLLDEADSFLRDRALARNSWEVTMVNELLTQMERHPGIFICATNLFEALDAAAIRRFTFKLQFHPLTEEQRVSMFKNETGQQLAHPDPDWLRLMTMKYLTPGDFATVKRQSNLFGVDLTPETWLEQLELEAKAKMQGLGARHATSADEILREVLAKPKAE